jgi:hypothetical protein
MERRLGVERFWDGRWSVSGQGFPRVMVLIGTEPNVVETSDGLIASGRVPGSSEWLILRAVAEQ